jgi:hypothetical protein
VKVCFFTPVVGAAAFATLAAVFFSLSKIDIQKTSFCMDEWMPQKWLPSAPSAAAR